MHKIIKKNINNDYIPFDVGILQIGSIIDFDCYIKRFNGYVIIIEQGTLITEKLFEKIQSNEQLYVHASEVNKHRNYCKGLKESGINIDLDADMEEKSDLNKAIENISTLQTQVQQYKKGQDKLQLVYTNICHMGYLFFNSKTPVKLPLKALETFIDVTLKLIVATDAMLPVFLKMMPNKYHIEYHSVNVSILSIFLGHAIGLQRSELQRLAMAAVLHDIGKLKIDSRILQKDSKLNPEEFETVQEHSTLSSEMASQNNISDKQVLDAILYHHEKLDGTGYPKGLKKDEIPKMAQIIGICDAFDALTTDRTFREKYSSFDALVLMRDEMSQHLNQDYIKKFIQLLRK